MNAPLFVRNADVSYDTEISVEPNYVVAWTRRFPTFSVFTVYRSPRTRPEQSWMKPVISELEGRCHAWNSTDVYEDETMMGGKGIETEYHIFDKCPGIETPHQCGREA